MTPPSLSPSPASAANPTPPGWLDAVRRLGPEQACATLRGAFAVQTTLEDGRTVLAVDAFARSTLCWTCENGALRVANRADAFASRELDAQSVFDYLFLHSVPAPRTIFRGVHRVPAGHCVVIDGGRSRTTRYQRLEFRPQPRPSFDSLKREFRALLLEAVQSELEDGIPACFLSGGTDSSTVAGHIKRLAGEVHTYSIGFDAAGYDEMEYARIAARHFGTRHHEYYVTPEDLLRHIPSVAAAYDQPFGNSSALPAYCCARVARDDGVSKLLAGDGGDELFGGNSRYAMQKVYGLYGRLPGMLRQGLVEPLLRLPVTGRFALMRKARNYVRDAKLPPTERVHNYNLLLRLGLDEVLEPAFLAAVRPQATLEQQRMVWDEVSADSDLDRHLAYDWRYTLAESDLPKIRGTSELAGIKAGYPLLDDRLVDFSMRLPTAYKLRGFKLRWFFKEALRDFLPEAIINKQKKGFGLPFGVWAMRHPALKALASDSVRAFAARGVVRPGFADALLDQWLPSHPGYYGEMVWILMMLEQWLRRHASEWRFEG